MRVGDPHVCQALLARAVESPSGLLLPLVVDETGVLLGTKRRGWNLAYGGDVASGSAGAGVSGSSPPEGDAKRVKGPNA